MQDYIIHSAYLAADKACAELHHRLNTARLYEEQTILPTEEERAAFDDELEHVCAEVAALPETDPVYAIVKRHLIDFTAALKRDAANFFTKPAESVSRLSWLIEYTADTDTRSDDIKAGILLKRLAEPYKLIKAIGECAAHASDADRTELLLAIQDTSDNLGHYAENVARYFPTLSDKVSTELSQAISSTNTALAELGASIIPDNADAGTADDESKCVPFSEDYYRSILGDTLGVDLDRLISWHESEIEHTRAEAFEIAARLPISERAHSMRDISDILNKYAGPCDTPDEMFVRTREYMRRSQAAAHDHVYFPDEECRLERVPYPLRETYPWGGYCDGDFTSNPIRGTVFLNYGNYRALTDGWLKIQAVHEAYPGHHVQYVRAVSNALPQTIKLGAKYIPLIEGVAHRSERLMEYIFDDDPFYPLFVAYRRHHTAVRIKSDLMLRYYGRPISECVALYESELGFDHRTARGQVRAQELMEGYFTCYYYGMKRISELEAIYGGSDFTNRLFSCGNISLDSLEAYLRLSPEDRDRYERFCEPR